MKSYILWDVTPFSPLKVFKCFGGTCRLHLQGWRVSQARNERGAYCLFHGDVLIGSLFSGEDGRDMFLWNVGSLSAYHTALLLRGQNLCFSTVLSVPSLQSDFLRNNVKLLYFVVSSCGSVHGRCCIFFPPAVQTPWALASDFSVSWSFYRR
jgi:hypothetical protein